MSLMGFRSCWPVSAVILWRCDTHNLLRDITMATRTIYNVTDVSFPSKIFALTDKPILYEFARLGL